ncbi:MAG: tape measure protein, partial [Ghiorsea sp.]
MMKAMTQIMSKGTVQMEELKGQLGDRLPGALGKAAKAMDTNVTALTKMIEQGQVLASEFVPAFAKVLQEDYADAALAAGKTVAGSMRKVSAQFELLSGSILNGGILMGGLTTLLNGVSKAFQTMNEHPRTTQLLFAALTVATTVYAGKMFLASTAGVALADSLTSVSVAGLAANATTGGLIIAAGLLVSALVAFSLDEAYAVEGTTLAGLDTLGTKVKYLKDVVEAVNKQEESGVWSRFTRGVAAGYSATSAWVDSLRELPTTLGGVHSALGTLDSDIIRINAKIALARRRGDATQLKRHEATLAKLEARQAKLRTALSNTTPGELSGKDAGGAKETAAMAAKYQKLAAMGAAFDGSDESRIDARLQIALIGIQKEQAAFIASADYKVTATGEHTQRTALVFAGLQEKRVKAAEAFSDSMTALEDKDAKNSKQLNMAKYKALSAFGAAYTHTETSRAQAQLDVKLLAIQADEDAFKTSAERKNLTTAEIRNVENTFATRRIDAAQQTSNKILTIEEAEAARILQLNTDKENARRASEQSMTAFISASSNVRKDISDSLDSNTIVNMGAMVNNYSNMTEAFKDMDKDSADYKISVAKGSLDMLSGLMNSTTRGQFELGKAAAYANTLLSTYEGVMKAWGQGGVFGFIGAGVIAAAGAANLQKIASTTMGSKGAKATAGADPSKSLQGTMPTSAPTQQAAAPTIINIHNTGNVMTDAFVLDNIIPSIQNVVATGDAILVSQ